MDTYIVTASRDGKFWLLEINGPGLKRPGATQVRRLDQAKGMARDWLMTRFDLLDDDTFEVVLSPVLPKKSTSLLEDALVARLDAMQAQLAAQEATTIAVKELSRQELTTRDIGVLLGISHQRVSQMINTEDLVSHPEQDPVKTEAVDSASTMTTRRLRRRVRRSLAGDELLSQSECGSGGFQ